MKVFLKIAALVFSTAGGNCREAFAQNNAIVLARSGKPAFAIRPPAGAGGSLRFAASELAGYLGKISGARFQSAQAKGLPAIKLQVKKGEPEEAYSIEVIKGDIVLSGNGSRAVLYAVYHFLEGLGCVWLAPGFAMYGGNHEFVPKKTTLVYSYKGPVSNRPVFAYRKIDIDGGRSHNGDNLKKMVDWMAKAGCNVLRVPVNLNGNGRVVWDRWRDEVLPELKKRDLILEAGGHGYQNFINVNMENGTLFKTHPEWFGKDSACRPSASDRLVFNTADAAAVDYLIANIVRYLQQHPEIKIFGLWPSDAGRWQDCREMEKYGTPQDRQAALANKVEAAIHRVRPDVVLEIIAYAFTLSVPQNVLLSKTVQVDYCPINQSFEKQIFDDAAAGNKAYAEEVKRWRANFSGDIGLYSYYRKYAWRSAPVVIPQYIQKDVQWYARLPLQGVSTYAEPGDWFTYELNHYVLARVAWNPAVNVDSLAGVFIGSRYPLHKRLALDAYRLFERITPVYGSLPFTSLKSAGEIAAAAAAVEQQALKVEAALKEAGAGAASLSRLLLMLTYLRHDLRIQRSLASNVPKEEVMEQIKTLLSFLEANRDKGVFILTGDNDLARFTKKYGLTAQSLLD